MTGRIALALRIGLYLAAGALAQAGLVVFDEANGTITLSIDDLSALLSAGGTALLALIWRHFAKRRDGVT